MMKKIRVQKLDVLFYKAEYSPLPSRTSLARYLLLEVLLEEPTVLTGRREGVRRPRIRDELEFFGDGPTLQHLRDGVLEITDLLGVFGSVVLLVFGMTSSLELMEESLSGVDMRSFEEFCLIGVVA